VTDHHIRRLGRALYHLDTLEAEEAWKTWLEGMRYYYDNSQIQELWDDELKQDSYYGFPKEQLRRKPTSEHHLWT
jgi:hypothetical protein